MLPSTDLRASAPRTIAFSMLNGPARPYRCRRFACPLAGTDARLAEKREMVTPSFQGTFTSYLLPVRLAHQIGTCEARIAAQIDGLTPGDDPDEGPGGGATDANPDSGRAAPKARGGSGRRTASDRAMAEALHGMMGVDLTAIPTIGVTTALTIAAEIGPDFSAFPSAQHFSSWLGLAPGTRISGGKSLPGRSPKVVNKVAQSLRMAAMSARRSQTFIGARHRGRLARKGAPVAITATARACVPDLHAGHPRGGLRGARDRDLRAAARGPQRLEPWPARQAARLPARQNARRPGFGKRRGINGLGKFCSREPSSSGDGVVTSRHRQMRSPES